MLSDQFYSFDLNGFAYLQQILKLGLPPMAQPVKNLPAMGETQEMHIQSQVGKISKRREWQPAPVFLPEKSRRQRRLAGHSSKGHREFDTTERSTAQKAGGLISSAP